MAIQKYIYDGDNVLLETDGSGVTLKTYTSTGGRYGDVLSEFDGSSTKYYEPDALGSTDALADATQAVTDRWKYRAFGAAIHASGSDTNPFTWVGRQGYFCDIETDLYSLRARFYDPASARFLSRDPIEFTAGESNLYCYVGNNPVTRMDPAGLRKQIDAECLRLLAQAENPFGNFSLLASVVACMTCPLYPDEFNALVGIYFLGLPSFAALATINAKLEECFGRNPAIDALPPPVGVAICANVLLQVNAAILRLGHPQYKEREKAQLTLERLLSTSFSLCGISTACLIIDSLKIAKTNKDAEIVKRAEELLLKPPFSLMEPKCPK